mmetsp:Transcript_19468/g.29937  ORF Transcript_19468/g.29937 Transcript_19468/m.29937 type:complete len:103 (+) Transcript_19468:397-705(+)
MGSANSGKSTLINALNGAYSGGAGGEEIAYVAKDKGKTFQLNFYYSKNRFDRKVKKGEHGMIVDTPGYGRTNAPVALKEKWWRMTRKYMQYGVRVNMVLLCI